MKSRHSSINIVPSRLPGPLGNPTALPFGTTAASNLAVWDYFPQTRSGYRVTIEGDRPV